jgi:hypothetical protein
LKKSFLFFLKKYLIFIGLYVIIYSQGERQILPPNPLFKSADTRVLKGANKRSAI